MPHDFRDWQRAVPSAEQAAGGDWAEVDSDWSYTVLARIGAPGSDPADGMSALRVSPATASMTPPATAQAIAALWVKLLLSRPAAAASRCGQPNGANGGQ
jgi:hypothetical protein